MDGFNDSGQWTGTWPVRPPEEAEDLKVTRKRFSRIGLAFFIGAVTIYAVQILATGLVMQLMPEWSSNPDILLMSSILPMYLIGMPLLILLVKRIPADPPERHPIKAGAFFVAVIMCFALVYISNILGNIITTVVSLIKQGVVQNEVFNVTSAVSLWLVLVYMVICAPVLEEYVFRKLIVDRTVRYGQGVAVVVSGLMFGLFHGNLNQFAYAFTLGVFLAFLYVKTGNLKITIALHMMINFVGGLVSTWLTQTIDLDEYMEMVLGGADQAAMMEYIMGHMAGMVMYLLFAGFVLCVTIAGAVLWIVCLVRRKFTFARGLVVIPKGKRFRTVILNVGMMLYSIFWIAMIILQLLL